MALLGSNGQRAGDRATRTLAGGLRREMTTPTVHAVSAPANVLAAVCHPRHGAPRGSCRRCSLLKEAATRGRPRQFWGEPTSSGVFHSLLHAICEVASAALVLGLLVARRSSWRGMEKKWVLVAD